jgi:hypothetical protein
LVIALGVGWLLAVAATAEAPFEGIVLDAETRQPIQGAVVYRRMDLVHVTAAGGVHTFYDASEVLTDRDGRFRIGRKWSLNPLVGLMAEARSLIYKAGYGEATNLGPSWLRERAASQKTRSPEERKKLGPKFYHDIEFDDGLPVFLLRKLTTNEERQRNMDFDVIGVPDKKYPLLRAEINREREALGLGEL